MVTGFLSLSGLGGGQGVQGGHWIMVYEYGYEKRKEQRTESQTEGKIQYFTLASISSLEHINTRGSTASHHHTEILKSCNFYHLTLFV